MSVQDDKVAGQEEDQQATDERRADERQEHDQQATDERRADEREEHDQQSTDERRDGDQQVTEKPEPDEDDKKKAAEMMTAYEDRPTLVLPGTGRMVTGTAVNDWLDEDGNPKSEIPDNASDDHKAKAEEAHNDEDKKKQIEEDKALNEELRKAAAEENKGEERPNRK
jgi:hypothetical protein